MPVPPLDAARALQLGRSLLPSRCAVAVRRGPRPKLEPPANTPNAADLAAVRRWVRHARRPTAIDVFSGCGGLSLGLKDAGFSVLAGADFDPVAVETYLANLGGLCFLGDLSEPQEFLDHLGAWGITAVDLVAGGVPCQPFSRAGRSKIRSLVSAGFRSPLDPRADLWRSFVDVVRALSPSAVLFENVPDLAKWDGGTVLARVRGSLEALGYESKVRILKASDYRVPQYRSRLFIVGLRSGRSFDWPDPTGLRPTLRDAIGDLPLVEAGQREERLPYMGPQTDLQRRLRRGVARRDAGWVYEHVTRETRSDDAQAFAFMPEGGTYIDVPEGLRRYRSDIFKDKYKRLVWEGLCRTITAHMAKDAYWYIHPEQARTLSPREGARVQTFPDWFRFAGEPSHRYRQIGNAVPPLLAEAVGKALMSTLRQSSNRARTPATKLGVATYRPR